MAFRWNIGLSLFLHALAFSLVAAYSCGGGEWRRAMSVLRVELAEEGPSAMRGHKGGLEAQKAALPEAHNPPAPQAAAPAEAPLAGTHPAMDNPESMEAAGVYLEPSPPGGGGGLKGAEDAAVGHGADSLSRASVGGPRGDFSAEIRAAIERAKVYPLAARKRGISGTVVAGFYVNTEGRPERIRVVNSSGYEVLDREAESTIRRAAPFPPLERDVEVSISFKLQE